MGKASAGAVTSTYDSDAEDGDLVRFGAECGGWLQRVAGTPAIPGLLSSG